MKQKKSIRIIICTVIGIFFLSSACAVSAVYAGEIAIVGNKDLTVDSLSKKDLKSIFLGKKTQWDNGKKIIFVILKTGDVHESFLKQFIGKSVSQYANFWKKMVFTGKGKKPKSFQTEDELVAFVGNTSGAVGYILSGSKADGVKSLSVN